MKNLIIFAALAATSFLTSCGLGIDETASSPDIPVTIWEISEDSTDAYCTMHYSSVWSNHSDSKEWLPIYHTVNTDTLAAALAANIDTTTGKPKGLGGVAMAPDLGEQADQYFVATEK